MNNPFEIQVWAQLFFPDGSVSQGVRVSAEIFDEDSPLVFKTGQMLLKSVNRHEGFMLVWGGGIIRYSPVSRFTSFLETESNSLASES